MARLLLDEDIKAHSLVRLLRTAGHDVTTTAYLGLDGCSDVEVLAGALIETRIILTYNCDDFRLLHEKQRDHAGIILVYQEPQKSMSYAEIALALANLENSETLAPKTLHVLNSWLY